VNIQQIKNFLVLCDTLNFRKAAGQINIVQPALSRQIQLLESEMGATLFNRSTGAVTLTVAGIFFQKEAQRILQDVNKTIIRTAQLHNGEAGEIRITHSSSAMNTVVPSFLVKVKNKWPDLKTIAQETSNFQQIEMLMARKTDMGIAPNIVLPTEAGSKILYKENFVLILPAGHPLSKKKLTDLSVLKKRLLFYHSFRRVSDMLKRYYRFSRGLDLNQKWHTSQRIPSA
jgi:DNA-binding transcriptional LysR family regulator